jgi:hypothetical protein
MFKLKVHEGFRTGMVAICDVCGKEIEGSDGNILWNSKHDEKTGDLIDFKLAHKTDCTQLLDNAIGYECSQDIDLGLVYLLNNAKINYHKVSLRATELAMWNL